MMPVINAKRLIERLHALGQTGRHEGTLTRLAAGDADKAGRDLLCAWMQEAGLEIGIDRIGNIIGRWDPDGVSGAPVVMGSHIDTVIDAGIYDGCYGVLSGLSVIEALKGSGTRIGRPIAVVAFTNEEGVRFAPDMMGSLVVAGGLETDGALATVGTDGETLGNELRRIGYAGQLDPMDLRPHAYVELHVEQGPVLEAEGVNLGAVDTLQGISWQRIVIDGTANHAGTTPMRLRLDAGVAAAQITAALDGLARAMPGAVATVGTMRFVPNAINVIPSRATFTVDLRHPDEARLQQLEQDLALLLDGLRANGYLVSAERLARFEPVLFDQDIVEKIETAATARQIGCRRMTSGAGHDAQMMARVCPSAMLFVPSKGGISHNPQEFTEERDLIAGAEVLMDVVRGLCA
ncbi:Zn-dependent hydrolase [Donghicola tyrosinivorans]|uniref:N-carbamoyl-L-amino-acid hydrolase n=1 Tax=Donghicola tyrosinivorans TaxID=1652492 RepID=A0A2T0W9B6_9RHOB|nr:Zn-dependent hydrolase [Donghicola tyrosinivorans]PRY83094.1 N-carbamoyl-L-amino-acid hydrolase [Donghicola tyrosinivorans]